jgi:hypothetical protein
MPAAHRKAILRPDNLRAHLEADCFQRLLHGAGVPARVPDAGDGAWEQRPGLAPVRAVIVRDVAELGLVQVRPGTLAPASRYETKFGRRARSCGCVARRSKRT